MKVSEVLGMLNSNVYESAKILICIMCADVIAGVLHYGINKKFASSACMSGIIKKIGELLVFALFGVLASHNELYNNALIIFTGAATLGELLSFLNHVSLLGNIFGLKELNNFIRRNTNENKEGDNDERR
nr:MAG TPA: holin [Caudoviricetes sp.]